MGALHTAPLRFARMLATSASWIRSWMKDTFRWIWGAETLFTNVLIMSTAVRWESCTHWYSTIKITVLIYKYHVQTVGTCGESVVYLVPAAIFERTRLDFYPTFNFPQKLRQLVSTDSFWDSVARLHMEFEPISSTIGVCGSDKACNSTAFASLLILSVQI